MSYQKKWGKKKKLNDKNNKNFYVLYFNQKQRRKIEVLLAYKQNLFIERKKEYGKRNESNDQRGFGDWGRRRC